MYEYGSVICAAWLKNYNNDIRSVELMYEGAKLIPK